MQVTDLKKELQLLKDENLRLKSEIIQDIDIDQLFPWGEKRFNLEEAIARDLPPHIIEIIGEKIEKKNFRYHLDILKFLSQNLRTLPGVEVEILSETNRQFPFIYLTCHIDMEDFKPFSVNGYQVHLDELLELGLIDEMVITGSNVSHVLPEQLYTVLKTYSEFQQEKRFF